MHLEPVPLSTTLSSTAASADPDSLPATTMIASMRQPLLRSAPHILVQRSFAAPRPAFRSFTSSVCKFKVQTRYTAEHEWVRYDDATNMGTIGITDYAQKSLGDVVFVELPSEGSEVKQGGEYISYYKIDSPTNNRLE